MDKPIKVGVTNGRTVVIDGHFAATTSGYDKDKVIVAALIKAGIIEVIDLDAIPDSAAE